MDVESNPIQLLTISQLKGSEGEPRQVRECCLVYLVYSLITPRALDLTGRLDSVLTRIWTGTDTSCIVYVER